MIATWIDLDESSKENLEEEANLCVMTNNEEVNSYYSKMNL